MTGLRILLVEDNKIIGQNIKKILEFVGYDVIGPIRSGEEALKTVEQEHYDLAVLDIELEGRLSGLEVAENLAIKSNAPIIFITGILDQSVREKAVAIGARFFINKPFNERNLVNAIDMTLDAASESSKAKPVETEHVFVKVNKRYIKVAINEIDFLESSGHYTIIYKGKEQISSSHSISDFLSKYHLPSFIKVHRSFAVNIHRVTDFDDTHIYFSQKMVPISQSLRKDFRERIAIL